MSQDNEKLVRAFYEATVPDHRERLWALQAPHVVYNMPEGMPFGCGHFEGLEDILERFLTSFYGALASDDGPIFSTVAKLVEALKRSIPEGTRNAELKNEALHLARELLRGT